MYSLKNYDNLLGTPGFSDQLLKNHFTLYEGYVTNVNKLAEAISEMSKSGKGNTPEYAELKRRFGWEWNGMRLHELYFSNLTKDYKKLEDLPVHRNLSEGGKLKTKLEEQFGSYENWLADFKASGVMRGIGWVILYHDPESGNLFNAWVNEHDLGHLAGATPLLVLDVFEHAYMLDYGIKKVDYLEAFIKAIDWKTVSERLS